MVTENVTSMPKPDKKVPKLDFSNLRQVKEFKDWYSYSKKLEDAIMLLRERIRDLEKDNTVLNTKFIDLNSNCSLAIQNLTLGQHVSNPILIFFCN